MSMEGDKWRVRSGDCLWNIANSVYNNPYRWTEIADANSIDRGRHIIYPGQLLILPGVSGGSPAPAPEPTPPKPQITHATINWFSLVSGSERLMGASWSYDKSTHFWTRWEQWDNANHLVLISEEKNGDYSSKTKYNECTGRSDSGWNIIRFSVRPVDKDGNVLENTKWEYKEYDFRNNPPKLPPDPTFEIDNTNHINITFNNIDDDINANTIEVAIYKNDTIKYRTAKINIDSDTHFAQYTGIVDSGAYYKVRARAVRGNIYGGWTNFTSNDQSLPVSPKKINTLQARKISGQQSPTYGLYVSWNAVTSATQYKIEYVVDNEEYFNDQSLINSVETVGAETNITILNNIDPGHTYFVRVRTINNKGTSQDYSAVSSVVLGAKPSAPTTWSNVSSAIITEEINLYWKHNSLDGSKETVAQLNISTFDSTNHKTWSGTITINNTTPIDQPDQNGVYSINPSESPWNTRIGNGGSIKWKARTAGLVTEGQDSYSDWSTERSINIYAVAGLTIDLKNRNQLSTDNINSYPFYIGVSASPLTQRPVSYYIEIISNNSYDIVDDVGNFKHVNPGDKVYQKYYEPNGDIWNFIVEMTPGIVDLQTNISYTIRGIVSMDSGLTAEDTHNFRTSFSGSGYNVSGNVVIDKETFTASINPYCKVGNSYPSDCKMSVYRREYDGSFKEIATNITNKKGIYIVDPHPSLDYARYRVVGKSNTTGIVSYYDLEPVKVGVPFIIIQWSEKWENFEYEGSSKVEVPWAGSLLQLKYNINTSEKKQPDVALVNYIGRQNPVSYYGTQLGETASWSTVIPKEDIETLYALRRLSRWTGDVYVREPSGTGYWANINVSLNISHDSLTIPVTLDIKRVEGGI
jgi:hypothetical protein